MRVRVPDYFDGFSCLAGACPHSCCIGWEVVLDEDTVRRYQQLPGALGERLRDAMALDGEDVCFPLDGRRCPFLNQENLCDIHCALGPEATSVTCREHPRFTEDYGAFREITLSAACPKANDLLLGYYCDVDGNPAIAMDPGELKYAAWVSRGDIELQPDDLSLTNEMMRMFKTGKI